MTDDQTVAALEVMTQTRALLEQQGTSFTRTFATYPLCCPSRATYLTGQYAHNHRVLHNAGPYGGHKALDHSKTLPVWLQRAGYRTINVGRYLNGYGLETPAEEIPPGWSDWHATVDPTTFNYASWTMNDDGLVHPVTGEHQTDHLSRLAVASVESAALSDQPFFLSVTYSAPHSGRPRESDDPAGLGTPYPAPRHRDAFAWKELPRPPNFDEANVSDKPELVSERPRLSAEMQGKIRENYQQELESLLSVDDGVAAIHAALARTGELDDTLFVFTSHNGFMHGEHRVPSSKMLPYEPSIRVPLLVRGPGVPAGRRDGRLVGNVDLAPTILDAAGATPDRRIDGRSLLPLARDPGLEWGRDILIENGYGANGVPAYRGIRTYRYLYVDHYETGEEELYDLRRDPFELRNLADRRRYEPLRRQLARRLRALARCRGARCRARPRLSMSIRRERARRGPRGRGSARCVRTGLRVGVRGPDARRVRRTELFLAGRRAAVRRRAPFVARVRLRRLRRGVTTPLRLRASTNSGRVLTLDRALRRCGA